MERQQNLEKTWSGHGNNKHKVKCGAENKHYQLWQKNEKIRIKIKIKNEK